MDAEFGLLQPWCLLLLPLPLIWLRWRRRRPRAWPAVVQPLAIRYPLLSAVRASEGGGSRKTSAAADAVVAAALVLFIAALAQPVRYTGEVADETKSEPVDLVIVAGTSISMTLQDYVVDGRRVDRMRMMRHLLDRFIADYRGRRIGLVVLGNPPALWLPLTSDKGAVRDAVSRLRTALGGRLSDMGATLQLVSRRFHDDSGKVVVMVTDGGLQLGDTDPLVAARALAENGDTLYVVGIGASDPGVDASATGGLIYEPIDPAFLQRLAAAGGGAFFHAQDAGAFAAALSTIESRHRRPQPKPATQRLADPWYPLPLGLAMLLLLLVAARPLLRAGSRSGARS